MRKTFKAAIIGIVSLLVLIGCSAEKDVDANEIGRVVETSPAEYRAALDSIGVDSEYIPGPGLVHVDHAAIVSETDEGSNINLVVFGSVDCPPAPTLKEVSLDGSGEIKELSFQASVYNTACTNDWGSYYYQVEFFEEEDLADDISLTYINPLHVESESEIIQVQP